MMKTLLLALLHFSLLFSTAQAAENEQQLFSKARKLFEQKKFKEAIDIYEKISAKSDRWLLALEEKAWAQMHLEKYDKVLSQARTLTSPALSALTGTEPYLLQALAQLKICDYVGVFKTLKDFKKLKREQVEAIQELAKKGKNTVSQVAVQKWSTNTDDWKQLGPMLSQLPQLFYRDEIMLRSAKAKNYEAMEKRLQELAAEENNENFRILQKLNLIEVETIQRVHVETKLTGLQGEKIEKGKYDLVFKDTNEIWLDELDSYQATINRCQKKSGRSM